MLLDKILEAQKGVLLLVGDFTSTNTNVLYRGTIWLKSTINLSGVKVVTFY